MAVKTIDPANDLIQGFDVSDGTPAEGTIYEFVKAAISSGQAVNLDYNPSTGRITINSRIASAAEVNAGATNNAVLTPSNLGGLTRLSNLAENLRKAIGLQGQRNGSSIGTRGALNLIPGTGINITMADDAANDRINATIAMASGGTGVWIGGAIRISSGFEGRGIYFSHNGSTGGWGITAVFNFTTPQPDTNYTVIAFSESTYSLGDGTIDPYTPSTEIPMLGVGTAYSKTTTGFEILTGLSGSISSSPVRAVLVFR